MANVPSIKLSSGADMPQVGFGLWKVGTDVAADTVYNAIKAGYRLFDGACGEFTPRFPPSLPSPSGPFARTGLLPAASLSVFFHLGFAKKEALSGSSGPLATSI